MEAQKISIGSDHAGFDLKEQVKELMEWLGYEVIDHGTYSGSSVDYPDYIHPVARDVKEGVAWRGIIICGSGNGASMTANKYPGIRAALCWDIEIARMARLHNDANILALPARYIDDKLALEIVKVFLHTDFEGGRHQIRIDKINIPGR